MEDNKPRQARRRLDEQSWRAVLERFDAAAMTVEAFCLREGLTRSSFTRWRTRLRSRPTRLPVPAVAKAAAPAPMPSFVDLGLLGASAPTAAEHAGLDLRIDLGAQVRNLPPDFAEPVTVGRVAGLLGRAISRAISRAIGDASGFPVAALGCCTGRPVTDARRRNTCAGVNRPVMHDHHHRQHVLARRHLAPERTSVALPLVPHALRGTGSAGLPAPQPVFTAQTPCSLCKSTGGAQPWP